MIKREKRRIQEEELHEKNELEIKFLSTFLFFIRLLSVTTMFISPFFFLYFLCNEINLVGYPFIIFTVSFIIVLVFLKNDQKGS